MWIDGLDEKDNAILTILEKNARATYSEIGEKIGISRVAVKNRIEALEKKGIIAGYKVVIRPENQEEGRHFFMDIVTEPEMFDQVVDYYASRGVVNKVYAATGESRLKIEGYASSKMKYEMFIKGAKRHLEGIRSITVQDVQYTIKDIEGGVDYVRLDERVSEDTGDI